jgi:hypothetical protein
MAVKLDFLQRIINVHWGTEIDQQGLLSARVGIGNPPAIGVAGPPIASALDSGDTFENVSSGASGLGYTVLTKGLVCFGQPRDADACFILSSGLYDPGTLSTTLKKGTLGEDGKLVWQTVASKAVNLAALTFAGNAFFAVYANNFDYTTIIETSFDGITWTSVHSFTPSSDKTPMAGGAVAAIENKDNPPSGTQPFQYVSVGVVTQKDDSYRGPTTNLAYATSRTRDDWNFGFNPGMTANPGSFTSVFTTGSNQASTVAGGNGKFIAAATLKTTFMEDVGGTPVPVVVGAAAVANSTTGRDWTTMALPGAFPGNQDTNSNSTAVTFVRTKDDDGYFLCAALGFARGDANPTSWLWKSSTGDDWTLIRSDRNFYWTLSVIAKDLSATTIVVI